MIRIDVFTGGTIGLIIAIDTPDYDPGTSYHWDGTATAVVVGQARVTGDGCKAWLWPQAGTYPGRGRSVQAVTAETCSDLAAKLRKRLDEKGEWWAS